MKEIVITIPNDYNVSMGAEILIDAVIDGVELPKGHGDLIDRSKIYKAIPAEEDNCTGVGMTLDEMDAYNDGIDAMYSLVHGAPTIIEADKGSIYNSRWDGDTIDEHRLAIGNVFRTKEEAEFEIERLKVIYELRQYAEPRCMKWDGAKRHFFIVYDISSNNIKTDYCFWYKQDSLSFSSEDKAWEAIKAVGEDRVKKHYLCVEEDNI